MIKRTLEERLKNKVEIRPETGDCWNWTGSKSVQGVGIININKRTVRVQRAAYMCWLDPELPDHAVITPICGNKLCINPNHLILDERSLAHSGRTAHKKGSSHPLSKLTVEDVRNIRSTYSAKKASQAKLAREYDVSLTTIASIIKGKTWKGI